MLTLSLLLLNSSANNEELHASACSVKFFVKNEALLKPHLVYKSDIDLHKVKPTAKQPAHACCVCVYQNSAGKELFLAPSHVYSVSKVIMKFVISMPLFISCELNTVHYDRYCIAY